MASRLEPSATPVIGTEAVSRAGRAASNVTSSGTSVSPYTVVRPSPGAMARPITPSSSPIGPSRVAAPVPRSTE